MPHDTFWDQALADFTELIRRNPKDAHVYRDRAITYEKLGEAVKAAADYEEAERLSSKPSASLPKKTDKIHILE